MQTLSSDMGFFLSVMVLFSAQVSEVNDNRHIFILNDAEAAMFVQWF